MPFTYTGVGLVTGVAVAFCPGNPLSRFTRYRSYSREASLEPFEPFNLDHLKYITSIFLSAAAGGFCGCLLDLLAENIHPASAAVVLLMTLAVSGDAIARKIDKDIELEAIMAGYSGRRGSDFGEEMQELSSPHMS